MNQSIIFFDGVCNLCSGFVQFIIARDTNNVFKFGSLQSDEAKKLLAPFPFNAEQLSTVVLLEDGRLFTRSTAALRILKQLYGWRWAYAFIVFPPFIRDAVYDLIAKYRYKIFGKLDECMIPNEELRNKFLDSTNDSLAR